MLISVREIENKIISAIESTPLKANNEQGEQSDVWENIYKALSELRCNALSLEAAQAYIEYDYYSK